MGSTDQLVRGEIVKTNGTARSFYVIVVVVVMIIVLWLILLVGVSVGRRHGGRSVRSFFGRKGRDEKDCDSELLLTKNCQFKSHFHQSVVLSLTLVTCSFQSSFVLSNTMMTMTMTLRRPTNVQLLALLLSFLQVHAG